MALNQAIQLGNMIGKEVPRGDDCTNIMTKTSSLLEAIPDVKPVFGYITSIIMGLTNALKKVPAHEDIRNTISLNASGDTLNKLAAAWFFLFFEYDKAGERLNVQEVRLSHYTDLPDEITSALSDIMEELASC